MKEWSIRAHWVIVDGAGIEISCQNDTQWGSDPKIIHAEYNAWVGEVGEQGVTIYEREISDRKPVGIEEVK